MSFSSEDSPLITDHRLDFGAYPSTVCGRRNRSGRERRLLAARQSCEARNPTIMPDVRRRSIAHYAADLNWRILDDYGSDELKAQYMDK